MASFHYPWFDMQTFWQINDTVARVEQPIVAGQVDVLFPWHGFSLAASKLAGVAILKVLTRAAGGPTPETIADCYQRGVDLVATYAQTPERNVRPQVYWRYVTSGDNVAGLELILSAQTSLLDSEPATSVESTLPPGEMLAVDVAGASRPYQQDQWQSGEGAPPITLFRPRDLSASYVEMIHPTDFAGVQFTTSGELPTVRWHLFPERLEKGVIRRGRVRGLFIPRAGDLARCEALYREFAASPLVLST
jgi:hypothetical protein